MVHATGRAAMLLIVTADHQLLLHLRDDKPGIAHPGCWAGFGGVHSLAELGDLKVSPFVRRAINQYLEPLLCATWTGSPAEGSPTERLARGDSVFQDRIRERTPTLPECRGDR